MELNNMLSLISLVVLRLILCIIIFFRSCLNYFIYQSNPDGIRMFKLPHQHFHVSVYQNSLVHPRIVPAFVSLESSISTFPITRSGELGDLVKKTQWTLKLVEQSYVPCQI